MLDIERMIDEGYLVDGSAESSESVRLMRSNEMPPPDDPSIAVVLAAREDRRCRR